MLTNQEYDFISNIYWDGYQEYLTFNDYNYIKSLNFFGKERSKKIEEFNNIPLTRRSPVTSNFRTLTIAKAFLDTCMITLVNK